MVYLVEVRLARETAADSLNLFFRARHHSSTPFSSFQRPILLRFESSDVYQARAEPQRQVFRLTHTSWAPLIIVMSQTYAAPWVEFGLGFFWVGSKWVGFGLGLGWV